MTHPTYKHIQCVETGVQVYTYNAGIAVCEKYVYVCEWVNLLTYKEQWPHMHWWEYQALVIKEYDLHLQLGSIYDIKLT